VILLSELVPLCLFFQFCDGSLLCLDFIKIILSVLFFFKNDSDSLFFCPLLSLNLGKALLLFSSFFLLFSTLLFLSLFLALLFFFELFELFFSEFGCCFLWWHSNKLYYQS